MEVCPCKVIGKNDNKEPFFIEERMPICLQCGQCMAVCKTSALKIDGLSYENDFLDLQPNEVAHNSFINFLANRRSIRNFKDKTVSDGLIDQILDSISYAPFGAEPEKMCITVVNDRKRIESSLPHIEKFLDDIVKWIDNPLVSRMIKRRSGPEKFFTVKNHLYPISKLGNYKLEFGDRITRNAPAIIIFHAPKNAASHTENSLIYATYAMLAAHSLGLGATMIGLVPNAINKVKAVRDIYEIPEENEAISSIIVGYPRVKYKRTIKRNEHQVNYIH
jgi:nitroreductase